MKLTETTMTIAAMLFGTAALAADPINDPRAELFRANGCEAEWLRAVENDAGEILYWTNTNGKGCPVSTGGPSISEEDEEKEEEVVELPVDPEPEAPCKTCSPEAS